MQKPQPSFAPLNACRSTLTAPSSLFALYPVPPGVANISSERTSTADSVVELRAGLVAQKTMTSRHSYDCFDTHDEGHFHAADELFDRGVWVGYLAEESRNTRYRHLPSFSELEDNHRNLNLPFPTPLPESSCTDREAVCRGCFDHRSIVLQLREIRFGLHSKVVIMPLKGADEAGLFCIMLPQPLDRSIKALEMFRPFEHSMDREDTKPFANDYMLLAIRDRKNNSGLLHTVRTTLSPAELSKIANRSRRQSLASGPSGCVSFMSSVEKTPQVRLQKVSKRKQQQGIGEDFEHHDTLKRSRMKALTGPRMTASVVNLSDDDTAEPLIVPNSRHSAPRSKFQQQTLVSPNVVSRTLLVQTSAPEVVGVNNSHFTPDQARRIQFVWKIDYEGMEHDAMRTLDEASTFRGLLETFREEAQSIPSATRQIKSDLWSLKYKMTDGTGNAVLINLKRPQFELHFVHLLRGLAEKKGWQEDQDVTVEIELKATMPGVFK